MMGSHVNLDEYLTISCIYCTEDVSGKLVKLNISRQGLLSHDEVNLDAEMGGGVLLEYLPSRANY